MYVIELSLKLSPMPVAVQRKEQDAALALFAQTPPTTVEGAIALAGALEQSGHGDEARRLITEWWRTRSFYDYILGGRSLGSVVTALSAGA